MAIAPVPLLNLKLTSDQGCQMLDRKYGKCLSNLWQKILENGKIFGNMDFSSRNGNIDFISYFFHTFKFFKFDN